MPKCPPTGGIRLQEVSVSGGSTLLVEKSFTDIYVVMLSVCNGILYK